MKKFWEWVKREPVAFWGGVTGIIEATVALLILTGALASDVGAGILLIVAAIGIFITKMVRGMVTPAPKKKKKKKKDDD